MSEAKLRGKHYTVKDAVKTYLCLLCGLGGEMDDLRKQKCTPSPSPVDMPLTPSDVGARSDVKKDASTLPLPPKPTSQEMTLKQQLEEHEAYLRQLETLQQLEIEEAVLQSLLVEREALHKAEQSIAALEKQTAANKVGQAAGSNAADHTSGSSAAGHAAGSNPAGHTSGSDAAGHTSGSSAAGHASGNNAAGHTSGSSAAGHTSGSNAAGSHAANQAAAASTTPACMPATLAPMQETREGTPLAASPLQPTSPSTLPYGTPAELIYVHVR